MEDYGRWWLNITIIDAFDRTCDTHPDKEALVEGENRFTFSQVREQAQKAALAFLELGIGKGSIILFQIGNLVEAVYTYLGLKTIGAVPVLLLPRHGQRELERFCGLTKAMAWIGSNRYGKIEYVPMLKAVKEKHSNLQHLLIVKGEAPPGTISFSNLMVKMRVGEDTHNYLARFNSSPNDIIHLAPTGGSTGLPKLVPKSQNQHLCKAYYFMRHLEMGHGEVPMAVLPITRDAPHLFTLCIWALYGGKLVLCPSTRPKDILEHIEKERVTFFFTVPTLLTDILNEPDIDKYDLSSLSAILCAGAHVEADLVKRSLGS